MTQLVQQLDEVNANNQMQKTKNCRSQVIGYHTCFSIAQHQS